MGQHGKEPGNAIQVRGDRGRDRGCDCEAEVNTEAKITLYLAVESDLFDPESDIEAGVANELGEIVNAIKMLVLSRYPRGISLDDWETEPAQRR